MLPRNNIKSELHSGHHLTSVKQKITRAIAIISKLRHFMPQTALSNTYYSLVHRMMIWDRAIQVTLLILLLYKIKQ